MILPAVDVFVFSRESVSVCHLPPTKEEIYVFARVRLFVCLSVCDQDCPKRRAWILMKCCVSTDVGTWTN